MTLVTGDRVTVGGSAGRVSAEPGPGRPGITFAVSTADGRVTVTPIDAIGRVAAGVLDPRLFDVTGLLEADYDRREDLPLIVAGSGGATGGLQLKDPADAVRVPHRAVGRSNMIVTVAHGTVTAYRIRPGR